MICGMWHSTEHFRTWSVHLRQGYPQPPVLPMQLDQNMFYRIHPNSEFMVVCQEDSKRLEVDQCIRKRCANGMYYARVYWGWCAKKGIWTWKTKHNATPLRGVLAPDKNVIRVTFTTSFNRNSKETCQLRNGGIENFRIDALILFGLFGPYIWYVLIGI